MFVLQIVCVYHWNSYGWCRWNFVFILGHSQYMWWDVIVSSKYQFWEQIKCFRRASSLANCKGPKNDGFQTIWFLSHLVPACHFCSCPVCQGNWASDVCQYPKNRENGQLMIKTFLGYRNLLWNSFHIMYFYLT